MKPVTGIGRGSRAATAFFGMFVVACGGSGTPTTSATTSAGTGASSTVSSSSSTGTSGLATSSTSTGGTSNGTIGTTSSGSGSTTGTSSSGTTGTGTTGSTSSGGTTASSTGTSGGTGTTGTTTGGSTGPYVPYDAGPRFQPSIDYDAGCTALAPRFENGNFFSTCVQCTKNKDCATGLVCDTNANSPFNNFCVQCANNSNCATGDVCNSALVDANLWEGNDQCQPDCRTNAGVCTPGFCETDAGVCYSPIYASGQNAFDNCGNPIDAGWCLSASDCASGACNLGSEVCPFNTNDFCFAGNNFGPGNGFGYCVPCTVDGGGCPSDQLCLATGCDGPAGTCVLNCFLDGGSCAAGSYCADGGPEGADGGLIGVCDAGCQNASDCGGVTPICSAGACVQCASGADCPDWMPGCRNNLCGSCSQNSDCPGTEQCTGGVCGCSVSTDCPLDVPSCAGQSSGYDGVCLCTDSAQCGSGLICETRFPYAVTGGSAAAVGGACITPCATATDCAATFPGMGFACETSTGYCVPCTVDQDCVDAADPSQPIARPTCLLFGDGGYPNTSPPLLTGGGNCACSAISQCNGGYTCMNPGLEGSCVQPCTYQGGIDSCFQAQFIGNCPQFVTPYCNTFTGFCQQCLDDYDCTSLYCGVSQCDGGMCM